MKTIFKRYGISALALLALSVISACDMLESEPRKSLFFDNEFSVMMPGSWSVRSDLNDEADLQMANLFKEAYCIIMTESKIDFDEMSRDEYSEITRSMIRDGLTGIDESAGEKMRTRQGLEALRYRIAGKIDGLNIIYWHVTLETEEHFHQVIFWSLKSKFDGNVADYNSVLDSFTIERT